MLMNTTVVRKKYLEIKMKSFICKLLCAITFGKVCIGWCEECTEEKCTTKKTKKVKKTKKK